MELKDVASVSGKGGLFRVLRPTRNGVILESIDQARNKFIAGANHRVSLLKEISIYTTTKEGSVPLEEVLLKIKSDFGTDLPVNGKSEVNELRNFIGKVVPEYDIERVYPSDIKKLISWYDLLSKFAPEIFTAAPAETQSESAAGAPAETAPAPKKAKVEKEEQPKTKAKSSEKEEGAEKKSAPKKAAAKKA
jgi:hypothetical protein